MKNNKLNKVSVGDFFDQHGFDSVQSEQFNVYRREEFACNVTFLKNNRRDFYKITLILKGDGILATANEGIHIKGNTLTFMNPMVPYSWEPISHNQTGFFCLFTDDFVDVSMKNISSQFSPLFSVEGNQIYQLNDKQASYLKGIFENMFLETKSNYNLKYDVLKNYVHIVLHEALKMTPAKVNMQVPNASLRLNQLFNALLNQQYTIEFPYQQLILKTAKDYAKQLRVEVNHLNKILNETTGKNTTALIAERAALEAKSLLSSTTWDISQIAYCLGFEHVSNFNRFFKRHFDVAPSDYRMKNFSDK